MLKKFLFIIVLSVLCTANAFAGIGFFFIEGGIGGRYIDGRIDYDTYSSDYQSDFELSRDPLDEAPLGQFVTDNKALGWKSKLVGNYNATIGFRVADKFVTSFSVHYTGKKAGYGTYQPVRYPNINTNIGENIERKPINYTSEVNWFSQIHLRATQSVYLTKQFFLVGGVEYSYLKFENGHQYQRTGGLLRSQTDPSYKDNTYGIIAGIGFELPMSSKVSLMATGVYAFSKYEGDELYYRNLDLKLGGLELGYTLRYYLK